MATIHDVLLLDGFSYLFKRYLSFMDISIYLYIWHPEWTSLHDIPSWHPLVSLLHEHPNSHISHREQNRLKHWMNFMTGSLKLSNFLTLPGEIYKSTQLLVQLLQEKNQSIRILSPCWGNSLWNAKLISCLFPWGKKAILVSQSKWGCGTHCTVM